MELEKRIVIGVDGKVKWGAVERVEAVVVGWKVPFRRMPRACAWAIHQQEGLNGRNERQETDLRGNLGVSRSLFGVEPRGRRLFAPNYRQMGEALSPKER